ncbi:hypothetical protein A4H97_06940 [Niastella yeongjuensis]|uniref:Uncharacterized protein n=1 Tax=Niastella yeongjuensis TaxID=354355 RepID=A0A1V9EN02_9BACT|nr:hypothetical protein A4H97_06940 [Niastella yeongjuensis]
MGRKAMGWQKAEGRRQKAEGRRQMADGRKPRRGVSLIAYSLKLTAAFVLLSPRSGVKIHSPSKNGLPTSD